MHATPAIGRGAEPRVTARGCGRQQKAAPGSTQGRLNLLLTLIVAASLALLIDLFVVQVTEAGTEVAAGAATEIAAAGEALQVKGWPLWLLGQRDGRMQLPHSFLQEGSTNGRAVNRFAARPRTIGTSAWR